MPYVIEGIVNDFQELIERPADVFKKEYKIDVISDTRARRIDRLKKKVYTIGLQNRVETIYEYDTLVYSYWRKSNRTEHQRGRPDRLL